MRMVFHLVLNYFHGKKIGQNWGIPIFFVKLSRIFHLYFFSVGKNNALSTKAKFVKLEKVGWKQKSKKKAQRYFCSFLSPGWFRLSFRLQEQGCSFK